jgi:hypothetical protein
MRRVLSIFFLLFALLPALAYANGNPVSLVDPFGLGAISDPVANASWVHAPTDSEQAIAGFWNFATLGGAKLELDTPTIAPVVPMKFKRAERVRASQPPQMVCPRFNFCFATRPRPVNQMKVRPTSN